LGQPSNSAYRNLHNIYRYPGEDVISASGNFGQFCEVFPKRKLVFVKPNITIAGQTAPGAGVTIEGMLKNPYRIEPNLHDVIIRFLRVRPPASKRKWSGGDCLQLTDIDHVIELGVHACPTAARRWPPIRPGDSRRLSEIVTLRWDSGSVENEGVGVWFERLRTCCGA
jgi:hypothetical protein